MAAPDGRKAGDLGRFCLIATSSFFCCPRAADCEAGEFTNFVGKKYQFKGKSSQSGSLARKSQTSVIGTKRTFRRSRRDVWFRLKSGGLRLFLHQATGLFRARSGSSVGARSYDAEIMAVLACMISAAGDHQRGVALAENANGLNPDAATGWYHSTIYTADYLKGDYEHALEVARQNQDAEMFYSYLEIIPIFGQLGLKQEALDAWKKLQTQLPDASAKTFEDWWRLWNMPEADIAKLIDGVHKSAVLGAEG